MTHLRELDFLGDGLVTDRDILETYRYDQATWGDAGHPLALARPRSTEEVQKLVAWAGHRRVPIVPRGAGTGISGGANAVEGCIVLSLERMKRILTLDGAGLIAVVEPGVINGDLKAAALERGCFYPPDPASFASSSLGGNVATNAGGLCCAKYGVTGDYVLALEAVLGDGTVLRTGSRSRKDVAGYDLKRLLVGSEGTLGVVTEITFRLRRRPPPASTLVASFPTLEASARAVLAIVRAVEPRLLELMDRHAVRAVEDYAQLELDVSAGALLFAQGDATIPGELSAMQAACESAGATFVATAVDEQEAQLLLNARRLAFPALERLGAVLADDVAVPLPALAEMFRRIEAASRENETFVATVAHAADGNLHPLVVFDRNDAAAVERAVRTFERLMADALELGGTITGEHGVGSLKRAFLPRQVGPVSLALQRSIKQAFDPHGILNPGKVLAPRA
ncbi:MAG TPA: FAD-linked oxidase C-terminal domain-containing protein [Polyangiaceae bacterium]